MLQEKHPQACWTNISQPGSYKLYNSAPDSLPLDITAEHVEKVAAKLSGAGGVDGIDGVKLKHWLLRFGSTSIALQETMAKTVGWLANDQPPWVAYRALMACRLVALDKQPGTRPVGIGSAFRHLMAKTLLVVAGEQATLACGNTNLCAGLPAGIEGAVHAITGCTTPDPPPVPDPQPTTTDDNDVPTDTAPPETSDEELLTQPHHRQTLRSLRCQSPRQRRMPRRT